MIVLFCRGYQGSGCKPSSFRERQDFSDSVLLASYSIDVVFVLVTKESKVTSSVILFGLYKILKTNSHDSCIVVALFLMPSLYGPIKSKVSLFANNLVLQIQNLANFLASGIWDNMVSISLESTLPSVNCRHNVKVLLIL